MYCSYCGENVELDARFCKMCGKALAKTDAEQIQNERQKESKPDIGKSEVIPSATKKKFFHLGGNNGKWVLAIIFGYTSLQFIMGLGKGGEYDYSNGLVFGLGTSPFVAIICSFWALLLGAWKK
jgi:zinc-ribbon domain